jgi:predicted Holliday junction resolvase-like endonuclease
LTLVTFPSILLNYPPKKAVSGVPFVKEIIYVILVIVAAFAIVTGIQWIQGVQQEAQRERELEETFKELDKDTRFSKYKDVKQEATK